MQTETRFPEAFVNHFNYVAALKLLKAEFDGSVINYHSRMRARGVLQAWLVKTELFKDLGDNARRRAEVEQVLAQPIDVPTFFADLAADRMDAECDLHGITDAATMSEIFAKHLALICVDF